MLFAFVVMLICPAVSSAQSYTIRDLGTQLGHIDSFGNAMNDKGEVVGFTQALNATEVRGFFIGPPYNGLINIGSFNGAPLSNGADINNHSDVVGKVTDVGSSTMILWSSGAIAIEPHLQGETESSLTGINDNGIMVGYSGKRGLILSGGIQTELLPLPSYVDAYPNAINSSGIVVGVSQKSNFEARATQWISGVAGPVTDLGGTQSRANDIADNGLIVGSGLIPGDTETHAFMVLSGGGATDLGTLGGTLSQAIGTNGEIVVGSSNLSDPIDGNHAFVYSGGKMQDLNDLIPASSGWVLTSAYDVNAYGQICGTGTYDSHARAFLLTPNPPTSGAADWDFTKEQNGWTAETNILPFEPAETQWVNGTGYGIRATGFPCFAFLQSPELTLHSGHTYRLYVTISTTASMANAAPQIRLRAFQTTTNMSELLSLDSTSESLPDASNGSRTYEYTITTQLSGPAQTFRFYLDYTFFDPLDEQDAWVYLQRVLLAED
jgi:probable HAF family extracellular repeat protein